MKRSLALHRRGYDQVHISLGDLAMIPNEKGFEEIGGRRGCNFFEWIDPRLCDRARVVIIGLIGRLEAKDEELHIERAEVEKLRVELNKTKSREKITWLICSILLIAFVLLKRLGFICNIFRT